MVNFIPSNVIDIATHPSRRPERRREPIDRNKLAPPPRPDVNYIPAPDAIRTLVEKALQALSRGVTWDRGSILNLLV